MDTSKDLPTPSLSYGEAMKALENILSRLENNELDVDDLYREIEHATSLIALCKKKLFDAENQVTKLINTDEAE